MAIQTFNSVDGFSVGPNIVVIDDSANVAANLLTVSANANITGNVNANGNVTGSYIIGNGSSLSSLTGANITGAVAYSTTANSVAGANVSGTVSSATTAGTVTTAAQGNITSVGTLTGLTVSGNANIGNITTGAFAANGEASFTNTLILDNGAAQGGSGDEGGELRLVKPTANTTLAGNINIDVWQNRVRFFEGGGTARGAYIDLTACGAGVTTNLLVAGSYGDSNVAAYLAGGTDTSNIITTGNVSGAYILGNGSSLTSLTGANVTGEVTFAATANAVAGANVSGTVSSATTAGTVTTAAQGNITSVGTLTSLAVTGNISAANITASTAISNSRIVTRVVSITSSATPTPNGDTTDQYEITALAVGATITNPTGTPNDGQRLIIRIDDNGSSQTLAWDTLYRVVGTTLPTSTTAGKTLYVGCLYNSNKTKWDVIALSQEV